MYYSMLFILTDDWFQAFYTPLAKLSIDFSNANSLQFLRKLTSARIRYSYIKSVSIVKIRGEVKYLKDLLDYCFPLKLQNLTIDFDPTFIDKKYEQY